MTLLTNRYRTQIDGVISCYDRIVITGTLPQVCYARGMTDYLYQNGIQIEFVRKKHIRKETLVKRVLDKRGYAPGLVHIISAMETCESYQPWHDKKTGKTYLKPDSGKCLHYYFYFIDEALGLCYIRVPTWCPFRLQIYFNGHNWLAAQLKKKNIGFSMVDNAFDFIEDYEQAQKFSDEFDVEKLHKILDQFAQKYCPVYTRFNQVYHWSPMQTEYATDIIFKQQADLQAIYEQLIRTVIHTVKPDNIATFLGRKLHGNYLGEVGNNYQVRIEGTRIKIVWTKFPSKCMINSKRSSESKQRSMMFPFLSTIER